MKRNLLIVSLGLNFVLAVAALWPEYELHELARMGPEVQAGSTAFAIAASSTDVPATMVTVSVVTNRFHWRRLESQDYAHYVANLRGIGCPDKTIRDIVVAAVEKVY